MRVYFGKDKFKATPMVWDTDKIINGHMMIVGGSGAGKTYTIRKILDAMQAQSATSKVSIMDVHGDIEVDGMQKIKFSEISPYGLNPLAVSPDPEFGGIRKRIQTFKSMLNSATKLGVQQEEVLANAMEDLYQANGFIKSDPETWDINVDKRKNHKTKKRNPTLKDLMAFLEFKLKQMKFGTTPEVVGLLEELNKQQKKLTTSVKKVNRTFDPDEKIKMEEQVEKTKEKTMRLFESYLNSVVSGREFDEMLRYNNADTVSSTLVRVKNVESSGIFKNKPPVFEDHIRIQNYDIKSLSADEQRFFVYTLLEEKFLHYKAMGVTKDGEDPIREIIVMDEAHIFLTDDPHNPINTIMKEARKYGLGIILASQSFSHFTEDVVSNVVTKLCLGIDEMFHEPSARKLRIDAKKFKHIVMQKTALLQIKEKGSTSNHFFDIIINVGPA